MATQEPENRSDAPDLQRVDALRRRLAEDPRSLAFVSLAEELNRTGEFAEAAAVAQRGLLTHPDSVAGRLALAVAESERDNVKEALEQIKRALIIDQENPKALALMGRILLKRGLAKRAVQFLSHAVKLAPTEARYGQLLQEARRQAQAQADGPAGTADVKPPVFDADAVPAQADPWTETESGRPVEHTVFDPDAVNRLSGGDPGLRDGAKPGEEPTAFQVPLPQPGGAAARKAKVGGSAAEYSKVMRRGQLLDSVQPTEGEPTVSGTELPLKESESVPKPPPPPPADGVKAPSARKAPIPAAPSVVRAMAEAQAESDQDASPSAKDRKSAARLPSFEVSPEAKPVDKSGDSKPKVDKRVGPAATRMVDDALWVLFGKRSASDPGRAPAASSDQEEEVNPPVRARLRGQAVEAPAPRVVRTSEQYGTWTQVAVITVLSVAGAFIGHWVMLSSAGPGPEVASEEVKGLASDLERGGLAALLAAEEKANELSRSAPDLEPLLSGVKAEIYGRRWRDFGSDPELRKKAEAALDKLQGQRPTVEHIAGLVAVSTSAADRKPLLKALESLQETYPDSPKIRVLQSKLHAQAGRERAALNALFEARARHKQHRATMLELARWYQRADAHAAAVGVYEQLLERFPLDVEAAIERYVLGQATGADPREDQAVSILAGLVRDEDPAVAKDETGRASLAFAVPLLARGQLVEGIEELAKAESAFDQSAVFKVAVAGAYFAVGELDRAEALYRQAAKLAPQARVPKVGLARIQFARSAGLKVDLVRESEKIARQRKTGRQEGTGMVRLPFGRVRLAPGRFQLVAFAPDPSIFPEDAYRSAEGEAGLAAANMIALAERALEADRPKKAAKLFSSALAERPTAVARFGLGRAQLAMGEVDRAVRTLSAGLGQAPDDVQGRLATARAMIAKGQTIEAINVLEAFERSEVVVPDGLLWLGRLRTERGDYEGAIRPLRTVVELQPQNPAARLAYGEALHRLRRTDDALASFEAALQTQRDLVKREDLSPIALMYFGRAELERSGRRGVALLKRALKHEDVPVEAHYYLGWALMKSRRTRREGRRELQQFIRIGPAGELRDQARRLLRGR